MKKSTDLEFTKVYGVFSERNGERENISIPIKITILGSDASAEDTFLKDTSWIQLEYYEEYLDFIVVSDGVLEQYDGNDEELVIPDYVTEIADDAFGECENLATITIPDSVTRIGRNAFAECSNLTSVTFKGNTYSFSNIEELYKAING